MAERFKAADCKSVVSNNIVGSNPTLSKFLIKFLLNNKKQIVKGYYASFVIWNYRFESGSALFVFFNIFI